MQRYQRKRHLVVWLVLALALPAVVIWGLVARKDVPVMGADELPPAVETPNVEVEGE